MAVSIDRVYQKVLALANKEQRGYITPQEFNLFADQAQMEIFEQYFYDLNQFTRLPGNSTGHSDIVTNLEEKISFFEKYNAEVGSGESILGNIMTSNIEDMYRLTNIRVDYIGITYPSVAEEIQLNEVQKYRASPLATWTKKRPVYTRYKGSINPNAIRIYPHPDPVTEYVYIDYIKKPKNPNWAYVVVNDKALYNSTSSTDFELHPSEESELVYRILAFSGIAIEKPQLTQVAMGLEGAKVQQEKQ